MGYHWFSLRLFEYTLPIPVIIISFISVFSLVPAFALLGVLTSIPSALVVKHFGKQVWNIWGDKGEEKIKYANYRGTFWSTQFEKMQEAFIFKYGKYLIEKADDLNKKFSQKLQKITKEDMDGVPSQTSFHGH